MAYQYYLRRGTFCIHADAAGEDNKDCYSRLANLTLLDKVDRALGQSEYFVRSNGTDHLLVLSHFHANKLPPHRFTNLFRCNTLGFENAVPEAAQPFDRHRIPAFYIGKPCDVVDNVDDDKTHDFALIATFKTNVTTNTTSKTHTNTNNKTADGDEEPAWRKIQRLNFKSRADVCEWLGLDRRNVSQCGPGDQCPALAMARYGFHVRGDTLGSNRLMDTIMSRTVPIFTERGQYDILPNFYPWKKVSYFVDVSDHESFSKGIDDLLGRPESEYRERLRVIEEHMHLLNHTQPFQFDGHMAELARELELQQ
jgi:hypothetical protein